MSDRRSRRFTDACCFHAAFGVTLTELGLHDPPAVLGRSPASLLHTSTLTGDGLHFTPILDFLIAEAAAAGISMRARPVLPGQSLTGPGVVVVDTFDMPHMVDHRRTHNEHALAVLPAGPAGDGVTRVVDGTLASLFDGDLPAGSFAVLPPGYLAASVLPGAHHDAPDPDAAVRELTGDGRYAGILDFVRTVRRFATPEAWNDRTVASDQHPTPLWTLERMAWVYAANVRWTAACHDPDRPAGRLLHRGGKALRRLHDVLSARRGGGHLSHETFDSMVGRTLRSLDSECRAAARVA
ncbi:hypothetical protein ACIA8K_29275 [Catenuloplanes sp. NPDC051500]|uniref:hypothetical protein n=1 Tax=Catenuloplanes sp. NPDC051500 TaxID=3363959 RepID=UPI00378854FA